MKAPKVKRIKATWKDIPGLTGLYQASNKGEIRRLYATRPPRVLRQSLSNNGRLYVSISVGGVRRNGRVSQLVCSAFHGPRPLCCQCAHNDGCRTNNTANNLSWKLPKDNYADRDAHGTTARMERCSAAKLCRRSVAAIMFRINRGESQTAVAKEFGVSQSAVSLIKLGKTWRAIGITAPKRGKKGSK